MIFWLALAPPHPANDMPTAKTMSFAIFASWYDNAHRQSWIQSNLVFEGSGQYGLGREEQSPWSGHSKVLANAVAQPQRTEVQSRCRHCLGRFNVPSARVV
jgi:hypothetical protein